MRNRQLGGRVREVVAPDIGVTPDGVGSCADELRLMGVKRDEMPTEVGRVVRVRGFLSRISSRACG